MRPGALGIYASSSILWVCEEMLRVIDGVSDDTNNLGSQNLKRSTIIKKSERYEMSRKMSIYPKLVGVLVGEWVNVPVSTSLAYGRYSTVSQFVCPLNTH